MKLITLQEWLHLFKVDTINFNEFKRRLKVKKGNSQIIYINDYKHLSEDILFNLYNIMVKKKDIYLTNFYKKSLDVKLDKYPICLNNNKNIKFKNIIRNLYFREILQDTDTVQPNLQNFLNVIINLFTKFIIDYKLLTPSVLKYVEKETIGHMLSGLFFRASIMNPVIPYSLSTIINYKFKVLTPTLGWSSYLTGMLQNRNIIEYVGIDVIEKVCNITEYIANQSRIKNDIYCIPSEDLYYDNNFMSKYTNYFDFIFFSPPYYQLELYKGENQSTNRYKSYEEWLEKYWRTTIKLCKKCIKKNKLLVYIMSGYNINNKYINLEEDMNNITIQEGFKYFKHIDMINNNVSFTKHRNTNEKIWFFYSGEIDNNNNNNNNINNINSSINTIIKC